MKGYPLPRRRAEFIAAIVTTLLFIAALPNAARAEERPRWQGGGHLIVAASSGEFGSVFGTGFGLEAFGVLRLDRAGVLGLRIQGGMLDYGQDVRSVPLTGPGPAFGIQVATRRNATTVGFGPQLTWPLGRLRPYAYATVDAAFFNGSADLTGRDSLGFLIALSTDVNRAVMGAGGGGGVAFAITQHVDLDAGAEFRRYHDVRTIGNAVTELPNGAVFMTENHGDLDLMLYRVGVTVSLPTPGRGRGHRRGPRGG
jgi:hypothetical protein